MNIESNTDPIELDDELDIEDVTIPDGDAPDDIIGDDDDEEEGGFFDDEADSDEDDGDVDDDEDVSVKKKPAKQPKKVTTKTYKKDDTIIRKFPGVGCQYKAKYFSIQVLEKRGWTRYNCLVLSSTEPSRWKVGDIFEAEEIAFYSEYYQFSGMAK